VGDDLGKRRPALRVCGLQSTPRVRHAAEPTTPTKQFWSPDITYVPGLRLPDLAPTRPDGAG
ncbi:MAG TPA: hypothetical protein VGJ38_13875, partial [Jatrophihabitantaceae bacterium]